MKKLLLVAVVLSALSACSNKTEDLKSPCVGGENSPCDRRSPSNQNWNRV